MTISSCDEGWMWKMRDTGWMHECTLFKRVIFFNVCVAPLLLLIIIFILVRVNCIPIDK